MRIGSVIIYVMETINHIQRQLITGARVRHCGMVMSVCANCGRDMPEMVELEDGTVLKWPDWIGECPLCDGFPAKMEAA